MRARKRFFQLYLSPSVQPMLTMAYKLDFRHTAATCCGITIHAVVTPPPQKLNVKRDETEDEVSEARTFLCVGAMHTL